MDGNLAKMTVLGFMNTDNISLPFSAYIAMFNPENFTIDNNICYNTSQAHGSSSGEARLIKVSPRRFQFNFLIDGTGASGEKREVAADILLFKTTTGFQGATHDTTFCTLTWGTFIATCRLQSMSVKYDLFRPDGTPLRATINASFIEHVPNALSQLISNLTSPDLTHVRTVRSEDELPLMCYRIYEDADLYMAVAEANGLDNFRKLKEGTKVFFPPIDESK